MKLLGIDFETTGPDPKNCDFTEVAVALYDTHFSKGPILAQNFLNCSPNKPMEIEAERITGITKQRCEMYGSSSSHVRRKIGRIIDVYEPAFLVAHNAYFFDKIIFNSLFDSKYTVPWIDTLYDLPEKTYDKLATRTLEFMAARLGFLNPFPHAALSDVFTMMRILMEHDVDEVVSISKVPLVVVEAKVSFQDKDLAKQRGYFWQQIRGGKVYTKKWVKMIKEDKLPSEREEAPFNVELIGGIFD